VRCWWSVRNYGASCLEEVERMFERGEKEDFTDDEDEDGSEERSGDDV
jgi:hypothetical protein